MDAVKTSGTPPPFDPFVSSAGVAYALTNVLSGGVNWILGIRQQGLHPELEVVEGQGQNLTSGRRVANALHGDWLIDRTGLG